MRIQEHLREAFSQSRDNVFHDLQKVCSHCFLPSTWPYRRLWTLRCPHPIPVICRPLNNQNDLYFGFEYIRLISASMTTYGYHQLRRLAQIANIRSLIQPKPAPPTLFRHTKTFRSYRVLRRKYIPARCYFIEAKRI